MALLGDLVIVAMVREGEVPGSSGGRGWGGERGGTAKWATKDFSSSWLLSSFLAALLMKLLLPHTHMCPYILWILGGVILQQVAYNLYKSVQVYHICSRF